MKKQILFLIVLFFFPGIVFAEEITQFDVDITINEDATIDVVESIKYDFGSLNRHGIYRDIPVKYETSTGDNRSLKINDIVVTDENGSRYNFDTSKEGKNKRIKIGSANSYVTGEKVYIIHYTVDGAINYFDTHDELYWNAIGADWTVPIKSAHVVAHASQHDKVACYFGSYGSTNSCDGVMENSSETEMSFMVSEFSQDDIAPGSYMTIVVGMPVGTVYKPTLLEKVTAFIFDNWLLGSPLIVLLFMWRKWSVDGRDPEGRGSVIPYYESPENLSPAEIGMMAEESVKNKHVSALIVDLAVRGYIKITREKKGGIFSSSDYTLTKTEKNISTLNAADERMLYESLFSTYAIGNSVNISTLKNKFYKDLKKIQDVVRDNIVTKGYYVKNPKKVRSTYMTVGVIMVFSSFFIAISASFIFAVLVSGVIIMIFGFFMPQRTKQGAVIREKILGLKLYLETAEKDRINFHNAPEKDPKKFEELLPYAMALGVEEQWAKQFEGMYDGNPEWYDGGSTSFSPVILANDMSSFGDKAVSSMSSTPSSAGSGGSGFSGGGGGGGFGGGGGGSW